MSLFDDTTADPMDKYAALTATTGDALSVPATVLHGAVAVATDIGTTLWNSLTPEKMEVSTQELLGRIDEDALQVYNENPDTIRTASFLGGMILPIGASMKAMGALRAGVKGASWFSNAGKIERLGAAEAAMKAAGPTSAAFNTAKWDIYRAVAANNIVDSAAAEIAILGGMSAHPFMEDYKKDLGTNFLIGAAIGGVIGTGIGTVIAKGEISKLVAKEDMIGNKIILDNMAKAHREAGVTEFSHIGEQVIVRAQSVENLKGVIADAEDVTKEFSLSAYSTAKLKHVVQEESANIVTILKDSSKGVMKEILDSQGNKEIKDFILDFATNPANAGFDKIGFAEVAQKKLLSKPGGFMKDTVELFKRTIGKTGQEEIIQTDAYFSNEFGRYFGKGDAHHHLVAADLGKTSDDLAKEVDLAKFKQANADTSIERELMPSAIVDAKFMQDIMTVEKMGWEDLNKVVIAPDDLSKMRAIYTRAEQLERETGEFKLSINIAKEAPSAKAIEQQVLVRGGLTPDYSSKIAQADKAMHQFFAVSYYKQGVEKVEPEAARALKNWIGGSYGFLRNGAALQRNLIWNADYYLSEEGRHLSDKASRVINHVRYSDASKNARDYFSKMSDIDGNVWLYRGLSGDPKGHYAVESYSTSPLKASDFGDVRLFKVHVDDIIGVVEDSGYAGKSNVEILAFPPTRDFGNVTGSNLHAIPDELLLNPKVSTPSGIVSGSGSKTIGSAYEMGEAMLVELQRSIQELKSAGHGIETISLRTGTPLKTVEKILSGGYVDDMGDFFKYRGTSDVTAALDNTKRTFSLSTQLGKVPSAEMQANLNKMSYKAQSDDLVEMYLRSSASELVRNIGSKFMSHETKLMSGQMIKEMEEFTGQLMKSSMVASANQVLAGMPSLSALATHIGKDAIALRNFVKESFEDPIAKSFSSILKNEAHLIEANTSLNVNASLSGFRLYKDGQFWQFPKEMAKEDIHLLMQLPDQDFRMMLEAAEAEGETLATAAKFRGKEYTIQTPEVRAMWEQLHKAGRELYEIKNTSTRAVGKGQIPDIGTWVPSTNFSSKEIAYVHDIKADKVTMIYARTPDELNDMVAEYEKLHGADTIRIIKKDQQKAYNILAGRHDPMYMEIADISKRHGGSSASTIVATDASVFQEILGGYNSYVNKGIDDLIGIQMHDVMTHLDAISSVSQMGYSAQKAGIIQKLVNKPTDHGKVLKNILMGYPNLSEHASWNGLQKFGQSITDTVFSELTDIFQPILAPVVGKLSGTKVRTEAEWGKIVTDMERKGIVNPFEGVDKELGLGRYLAEGKSGKEGLTMRTIALGNGLAATVMLRFMELGQPLVNALSLPILTSGAVGRKLSASFLGNAIDPNAKFTLAQTMHDGIRLMNHPTLGKVYSKLGEERNLFSSELRNVTEMMQYTRNLDASVSTAMEDAMESQFVKLMSKPSDYSEAMVRKVSFFNGIALAKKAYPGISDKSALIFARNFMDEAVGNYTAAQRPAMFQGTFGTAAGLFQTYMLTLGQQIYRQVEHRDWRSLGKMLLAQSTIFGTTSLPGFHPISEAIADHFSDQNTDLQTGLFRAIPDPAANMILYGLPSSFGPGISTRGDIQPRGPNPIQGINSVATVNIATQMYTAMERVASAAFSIDGNVGKATLEAISLQSVSRPLARLSELATGVSLTGSGDIVASNIRPSTMENLLSLSTLSRVFATRPLAEIKAREAQHLNSLYGGMDSDRRKAVAVKLKSHIRAGSLNDDTMEGLAYEYLRTGSPTGWRSAVNDAIRQTRQPGTETVQQKLKPGSPLNLLIDDLD